MFKTRDDLNKNGLSNLPILKCIVLLLLYMYMNLLDIGL